MKTFLKIILSVFIIFSGVSCENDDEQFVNLENLSIPSNLGATFQITHDNSGLVTIIPTGVGVMLYKIDFDDGSPAAEKIKVGEKVEHIYAEGDYEVVITGTNVNGETAQGTQALTVSFLAPKNLEVVVTPDPTNNYKVTVSATAQYAAMFEVYFGETDEEEPVPLMVGEMAEHIYQNVGNYTIRVVALSGGAATTEITKEVTIKDPLFLPIDFESKTLDYTFTNFGGGEGVGAPVVDNPDPTGINTSGKVASYTKPVSSEAWAGTSIALAEPIDFSSGNYISVDVWSPISGATVLFKIENLDNADVFVEATTTTTVSNQWETLIFDMSAMDPAVEYGRIALFFNFNVAGTGKTYYFDNIKTTKLEQIELPLTFESSTLSYTWAGFGGASGGVIDNPDISGINTSTKVTELIKNSGAQTWGGISLDLDQPLDFSNGNIVRMKVWAPKSGIPILFKLEDSSSPPGPNNTPSVFVEVTQNTTVSNEWEELSFDLSTYADFDPTVSYDRVIVFYDFGNLGEGTSFYFDDISLSTTSGGGDSGEGNEPSSAAPIPNLPAENVISMFSGDYTNVPVDTWRAEWSVATLEEVSIAGNAVKKYSALSYVGIETASSTIDAGAMTHFHTDIWTSNLTEFKIKLVDFGANGVYDDGGDDVEHEIVVSNPAQNEWVSIDIPLSDFVGLTTKSHIAQLIYSGTPTGSGTVFIDNVYFHN